MPATEQEDVIRVTRDQTHSCTLPLITLSYSGGIRRTKRRPDACLIYACAAVPGGFFLTHDSDTAPLMDKSVSSDVVTATARHQIVRVSSLWFFYDADSLNKGVVYEW